jgi:methionyl-tRNA synthetase
MAKKFLVTTPIYYPNGYPHIGHANSSFIADVYARYKRLLWYDVKFSTGNDENSQKILQQAQLEWIPVDDYLEAMAEKWEWVWKSLDITIRILLEQLMPSS